MLSIFFLLWSLLASSQQFEYQLEGSFQTRPSLQEATYSTVNYSIYWNETETEIQGLYQDNFLTLGKPLNLDGTKNEDGRKFNILLPVEVHQIRQILITTPKAEAFSGSLPLSIVTKDNLGTTIDNISATGIITFNSPTSPSAVENECEVGFGALTKFCGLYDGSFLEILDSRNRCDLLGNFNPRLELSSDTVLRIYLNYIPGITNNEFQIIGSLLPSPTSTNIQVSSRNCGPLPGTSFVSGNCKILSLSGIFYNQINTISFTGTYSILDEINGDICTYSLT